MLRGSYSAKIDDKGRLKIPNAFKALVEEQHGASGLYVTSLTGDSVRIYPMPVWLGVEQRHRRDAEHAPGAAEVSRPRQLLRPGRPSSTCRAASSIPPRLRDAAGMAGDVDVLGQVDYLEVWNHERFLAKLQREPFTDDDARALAEFGI